MLLCSSGYNILCSSKTLLHIISYLLPPKALGLISQKMYSHIVHVHDIHSRAALEFLTEYVCYTVANWSTCLNKPSNFYHSTAVFPNLTFHWGTPTYRHEQFIRKDCIILASRCITSLPLQLTMYHIMSSNLQQLLIFSYNCGHFIL